MANLCDNNAYIAHQDSFQIEAVLKAIEDKKLFTTFVPVKEGETQSSTWGTKWDAFDLYVADSGIDGTDSFVQVSFNTAWAPPIEFYQAMENLGFTIVAHFSEPGMQFCGSFENGNEVNYDTSEGIGDVPCEIIAMFGLEQVDEDE